MLYPMLYAINSRESQNVSLLHHPGDGQFQYRCDSHDSQRPMGQIETANMNKNSFLFISLHLF